MEIWISGLSLKGTFATGGRGLGGGYWGGGEKSLLDGTLPPGAGGRLLAAPHLAASRGLECMLPATHLQRTFCGCCYVREHRATVPVSAQA